MLDAAIVTVGNELLYGETTDTNAAWLGRTLGAYEIGVVRRFTVGDVEADIQEALARAMDVAQLVIVTGGLGPTPDDVTKASVAKHLGLDLVVDEEVRASLQERFRASGFDVIPPRSEGQAEIPSGAIVLHNPAGTAPGLLIESEDTRIVLLPGVPRELEAIVDGGLKPVLQELGGVRDARIHHRVVHTTGLPETRLAERLEARLAELPTELLDGIKLAYLPDLRGVDLRLTIRGGAPAEAEGRFDRLLAEIDDVVGPFRFESTAGDVADAVVELLRGRATTLAVAESCTGGLIAKRLTDLPGVSDIFLGGFVSYENEAKTSMVGVSGEDLARDGAVSQVVAEQLASGAAERLGADVGIGVTGIAGPGGGSDEKPVGTVWIGTAVDGRTEARLHHFAGDRSEVRERAAQAALAQLYRRLEGISLPD